MKKILLFVPILIAILSSAQVNIIPKPVSLIEPRIAGNFSLTAGTQLVLEGSNLENSANFLNSYLQDFYGFKLPIVKTSSGSNVIRLNYERLDNALPGAYRLIIDKQGVYLAGDNETGVFYGIQTLIQLLPTVPNSKIQIPFITARDYPRFAYRGMHLDVGRHFFPISFVKKYIDYIALHKMNYFHWHLTEDQGWRIQIKKYPKLTEVGAWRNGTIIGKYPGKGNDGIRYGGYYTQDEIKDVVDYAAKRYITVVPEIEMPGHSSAAIASYPWLSCFPAESTKHPPQCAWSGDSTGKQVQQTWGVFDDVFCAGKDSTFMFLQDVLDEVMTLFPSKYIHVGGDECPKTHWERCPLCQKRIRELHLKDEHELQSYFIQRIEKYLNSKGRTLIGWDEILEGGLAPKAVVMSWRGEEGGIAAAKQKHDVIMTPLQPVYFNLSQSRNEDSITFGGYISLEQVYNYNPVPKQLTQQESKYVLGSQGNVWTEYMDNEKLVEYMIFPRMSALSEVLWSAKRESVIVAWSDFQKRLATQIKRYDLWKAHYSKAHLALRSTIVPDKNGAGIKWKLENKTPDASIAYKTPGGKEVVLVSNATAINIINSGTYTARLINMTPSKIMDRSSSEYNTVGKPIIHNFFFNKATGKKITLATQPSPNYPGDGAFTLINGIQNENGLENPQDFLGFQGSDCEAMIDLGSIQQIANVKAHVYEETPSWIWRPKFFQALISRDNNIYTEMGMTDVVQFNDSKNSNAVMTVQQKSVAARYIKVKLGNYGSIPAGNPGAGNNAWLFVDEIEVN